MTHALVLSMPTQRTLRAMALALWLSLVCALGLSSPARAAEMDAQRIIDSLKPDTTTPMRTRSLRNLQVEQVGAGPSEAPPSVSLTVGFHFDSARLSKESADTLNQLAKALQSSELRALSFKLEGHTDGKGGADYNLKLSQARAQAVKAYLEKQGVAADRLTALGKGDTELVNAQDRFAAENRRVKVITRTP